MVMVDGEKVIISESLIVEENDYRKMNLCNSVNIRGELLWKKRE